MKSFKLLLVTFLTIFGFQSASAADKPALDGYCPVCYIAAGKANKGDAKFSSTYNGKIYYSVSAKVKKMFDANPTKWLPQYDGYCAYGVSLGKKFKSNPTVFSVVDGKVYLNKDKSVAKLFAKDKKGFIKKANIQWKSLIQ